MIGCNPKSQYQWQRGAKMNFEETQVVVTNVRMPFFSMVVFMVKWALAAIPALLILGGIITSLFFLILLPVP